MDGIDEGVSESASLGHCVGIIEEANVMSTLGKEELDTEGSPDGKPVDLLEGIVDGVVDCTSLGLVLCIIDGPKLGFDDGSFDISSVGPRLGSSDRVDDGTEENSPVGCGVRNGGIRV